MLEITSGGTTSSDVVHIASLIFILVIQTYWIPWSAKLTREVVFIVSVYLSTLMYLELLFSTAI